MSPVDACAVSCQSAVGSLYGVSCLNVIGARVKHLMLPWLWIEDVYFICTTHLSGDDSGNNNRLCWRRLSQSPCSVALAKFGFLSYQTGLTGQRPCEPTPGSDGAQQETVPGETGWMRETWEAPVCRGVQKRGRGPRQAQP